MIGSRSIRLGAYTLLLGLLLLGGGLGGRTAVAEEPRSPLPPPRCVPVPPPPPPPGQAAPAQPTAPGRPVASTTDVRARLAAQCGIQYLGELHFLEHLGWRFTGATGINDVQVLGGTPCQRDSLRAAQAAGDLRVLIPAGISDEALKAFGLRLPALSDSMPSLGAYNHRLAIAVKRATEKLTAASDVDRYVFPKVLVLDSPWWQLHPPEPEWVEVEKLWHPQGSPARAIEAFYTRDATAECYVGQLVALWATQYELLGPQWFDEAYRTDEIWIGRPTLVENVPFSWHRDTPGYHRRRGLYILGARQNEDPGAVLGELGHIALAGRCGIIQNQDDGYFCNENFVIVSATPRAAAQLRLKGGFRYVAEQTQEALSLHKSTKNLLAPGDEIFRKEREVERILAQPVFAEIMVYIHPFGVVPLREIVEKKLKHKTAAIEISLYSSGRDYAFYLRYRISWIQRWILARLGQTRSVPLPAGS